MKTLLTLCALLWAITGRTQTFINVGTTANDGTGDKPRAAGITINTNFFAIFAQATAITNGLFALETTRNAAVSNALVTLLVANDTTTSNGLYSVETTRNAAVSNALVALISGGTTNYNLLNADRFIVTNHMDFVEWSMGVNTNGVIPWGATNSIVYTPSNTFTITMSGTPPTGLSREIDVLIINTNSANGYFPTNDLNGGTVYMLPAPSTNRYKFNWKGGRFWISSGQQAETGTNAYMRTRTGVRRTMIIDASYFVTNGLDQAATPTTYTSASNKKPMNALYFDTGLTNSGFSLSMPPEWDRNDVTLVPVWTCTNGSGNVVFQFATDWTDNDDTLDGAFGSNVNSIDTVLAANDTHVGPSATPTFGNSASTVYGNLSVRLRRTRDHASDTLDAGVFLLRVLLQYTESTTEPSALP